MNNNNYMRKISYLFVVMLLAGAAGVHAQSLKGTSWKLYVDELHDTLTFHVGADTTYTTDGSGDVVVRSLCKINRDTITLKDFEGRYACPGGEGVYTYVFLADGLTLNMVSDPCDNRSNAINGVKWMRGKDERK